jgi:DNA polymerase II small subunit/DNA polymerase delta subunit B
MGREQGNRKADEGDAVMMMNKKNKKKAYAAAATKGKTLESFENTHGQPKMKALERQLATERAKVEALADVQGHVSVERAISNHVRFAVTGDTHIGSLYAHPKALKGFYEYAQDAGCEVVYHAGDVLDGHRVYRGQEFELRDIGLDAQVERLAEVCPRNVPTSFIVGNHDQSFKVAAGAPVGKLISQATGWTFLGEEQARVEWQTPNGAFSLQLIHPGGGSSYALSYRCQKIVESLEGGTKPDMLAIGHYHKAEFIPSYRNVALLQTGTFQRQTPFMARQGLAAHVGGWIIDVTVGEGHNVIRAEFVAFYV